LQRSQPRAPVAAAAAAVQAANGRPVDVSPRT
jgi:hypothetical protein